MAGAELLMRRLDCQPLTAAAFAPFGLVIDATAVAPEVINDGSTQRHSDLATLDLRRPDRDPVISIYIAKARQFPLRIAKLERHQQASQAFIPLGAHRFIVVVAPGGESPDWQNATAFLTAPGQAICLHRNAWHHGLIALADGDRFAVIEGGDYRLDTVQFLATDAIELHVPDDPMFMGWRNLPRPP
jgi:ureidoglycolate lyase